MKSAKPKLKCAFKEAQLIPIFDESTTLLYQVEACFGAPGTLSEQPRRFEGLAKKYKGFTSGDLKEVDLGIPASLKNLRQIV